MNMKKTVIALGAALLIGLSGCGKQTQIQVEHLFIFLNIEFSNVFLSSIEMIDFIFIQST